jgi:hypothetical protein
MRKKNSANFLKKGDANGQHFIMERDASDLQSGKHGQVFNKEKFSMDQREDTT